MKTTNSFATNVVGNEAQYPLNLVQAIRERKYKLIKAKVIHHHLVIIY